MWKKNSGNVWCTCIQTEVTDCRNFKRHVKKCADKTSRQSKPFIQSRYCIALIFTIRSNMFIIKKQRWKCHELDDQGIVVLWPAMTQFLFPQGPHPVGGTPSLLFNVHRAILPLGKSGRRVRLATRTVYKKIGLDPTPHLPHMPSRCAQERHCLHMQMFFLWNWCMFTRYNNVRGVTGK
jgi:hypothetical protein